MPRKTLPAPYRSMMTAADDHYHAVRSINIHGEIAHANAVAQEFLKSGAATTQAEAVRMAADEISHTQRLTRGEMVNRAARKTLDKRARAEVTERSNTSLAALNPASSS
ncbi:hypothetical protein [Cupriavidus sp. UYPR2.512]|uniref:hypothetical protein n=1 Tax=Cupriavidus sp. UYPR2.512 TaxID=1080187 RepID=UPI00036D6DCE|nr:hypothetical protein [Cupriavidus sp. UYPR2.512]UIF86090.1 hypothetical protein KAF44_19050 [Cupriavidus necator]